MLLRLTPHCLAYLPACITKSYNVEIMFSCVLELSSGSLVVKSGDHSFSRMYTGKPQNLTWQRFGLRMYLPGGVLPSNVKECQVRVKVLPSVNFQLPEDTELVSGLYLIDSPVKHVKVEVQHCVAKRDLYRTLTFIEAKGTLEASSHSELYYHFKIIDGGLFPQIDRYGTVQLSPSSVVGIVSSLKPDHKACQTESLRRYLAKLYYSSSGIHSWNVYLVIMWNLDVHIAVSSDIQFVVTL